MNRSGNFLVDFTRRNASMGGEAVWGISSPFPLSYSGWPNDQNDMKKSNKKK